MIVIPINGKNQRMGGLFKTPKHLLLYNGRPAIVQSFEYMSNFGKVIILANHRYVSELEKHIPKEHIYAVDDTDNPVETVKMAPIRGQELWIVDCDIIPEELNPPKGNTVYCFENTSGLLQYSNFDVDADGVVLRANEKKEAYKWAGAGVYYFSEGYSFYDHANGSKSIAEIFARTVEFYHDHHGRFSHKKVYADTSSKIVRFGTLPDITGGFTGNKIQILKTGNTIQDEEYWYSRYEDKGDLPKYEMCRDGLLLEFLSASGELDVQRVFDTIEKYRYYVPMNRLGFDTYIKRIESHLFLNPIDGADKLLKELKYVAPTPTFCHGDLSSKNIIPTSRGMKLIDPLYSKDKFGSYLLDYAKFLFSLKFYDNDLDRYNRFREMVNFSKIDVLIASECVRVCTYNKKFNFIAENLIAEL